MSKQSLFFGSRELTREYSWAAFYNLYPLTEILLGFSGVSPPIVIFQSCPVSIQYLGRVVDILYWQVASGESMWLEMVFASPQG